VQHELPLGLRQRIRLFAPGFKFGEEAFHELRRRIVIHWPQAEQGVFVTSDEQGIGQAHDAFTGLRLADTGITGTEYGEIALDIVERPFTGRDIAVYPWRVALQAEDETG
jgi:hypothetical protein